MTFSVACECGKNHTVSEGSAGSRFHCYCGLTVNVPSLARLRDMAGLAPIEIPLEFEIPELLESGVIPNQSARTVAEHRRNSFISLQTVNSFIRKVPVASHGGCFSSLGEDSFFGKTRSLNFMDVIRRFAYRLACVFNAPASSNR